MQLISPRWVQHTPTFLVTYLLSSGLPAAARKLPNTTPVNPFLDPKDDPNNPLGYIASNTLTGVALSVYNQFVIHLQTSMPNGRKGLVLAVALMQTFNLLKWGARWMVCMTIGAYSMIQTTLLPL